VSVAGESIADYVKLVRELGPLGELVEFNISSPNTKLVYEWSRKPGELATLLREVREATAKPLIVKLSPDFADVNEREIIPAALPPASGSSTTATPGGSRIDAFRRRGRPLGPDLFPATLDNVRRTRRTFGADLEIIATGGVDAPENAWQLLHEGANAVGYFTGFITRGPILARQILERLLARPLKAPGTSREASHLIPLVHRCPATKTQRPDAAWRAHPPIYDVHSSTEGTPPRFPDSTRLILAAASRLRISRGQTRPLTLNHGARKVYRSLFPARQRGHAVASTRLPLESGNLWGRALRGRVDRQYIGGAPARPHQAVAFSLPVEAAVDKWIRCEHSRDVPGASAGGEQALEDLARQDRPAGLMNPVK